MRIKATGTLQFDMYLNGDQSECIVPERYRVSEALIEHAPQPGILMEVILATGTVSGELPGEPSERDFGPQYGSPLAHLAPRSRGSICTRPCRILHLCPSSDVSRNYVRDPIRISGYQMTGDRSR
ncbi:MAG TPA: hypothetical protein VG815_02115 [Chloroflexota bacterium]|nr:hypothetical protein [Chloroflexota bacterium]